MHQKSHCGPKTGTEKKAKIVLCMWSTYNVIGLLINDQLINFKGI